MNRAERRAGKSKRSKPPVTRTVWQKVDTIRHAMQGAAITPASDRDKLAMRELAAIDAFTRGQAGLQEWQDLAALNNVTQTLATMDVGRDAMPDCHKAEAALVEAAQRFERTGKMGLSGPGIQAVREVIEWHDAQRQAIPRSKYEQALRLTVARVKSGHATVDVNEVLRADKR